MKTTTSTTAETFKAGIFYYNPDDDRLLVRVPGTVNRYVNVIKLSGQWRL